MNLFSFRTAAIVLASLIVGMALGAFGVYSTATRSFVSTYSTKIT